MADGLTHLDGEGHARMVDVSAKPETPRRALVEGRIRFSEGILDRVLAGDLPKGGVLETARLAGVMGAKRTADLIPMCHPLRISKVRVDFHPEPPHALRAEVEVFAVDRTGVEMEALTAAMTACLTVYDMVKAVDQRMVVEGVRLLEKDGGQRGSFRAENAC